MAHISVERYKRKMDFLTEVPSTKTLADAQREDRIQTILEEEEEDE